MGSDTHLAKREGRIDEPTTKGCRAAISTSAGSEEV
jgi:hypothetical protein